MRFFRDTGHLFRLAAVFAVGTVSFLGVRSFLVPHTFGEYGHYRGNAISEVASNPIHFAGHQSCETCHSDIATTKSAGKHAQVNCEACHGPLEKHADDPASVDPGKPDTAVLCARCHTASAAKPKGFPQVDIASHSSGLACETCHQPHNPVVDAGGTK